jgi:hypothetical protein
MHLPKANLIEQRLKTRFAENDNLFTKILSDLESCVVDSSDRESKRCYDAILAEMRFQLMCNLLPDYRHLKSIEDFLEHENKKDS